ncbi:hypothetical protein GCM10009759_62710 [Kitasatospora saccharophila]|uniref:Uncharacterized protein n=1 Tax=Kitasatospora saccharophila TaxID=407973 RepID=A0ABN2XRS3_9ACTN
MNARIRSAPGRAPRRRSPAPDPTSKWEAVRGRAAAVFDLGARLPAQVFRGLADEAVFCEFDVLLTPDAGPALAALARSHGDRQVDLLVVEGAGVAEPVLSLSVDATADDYWAEVGFDAVRDPLESVTVAARVVALTGPSGRWGCRGERDPEVAVLRGLPDGGARDDWSLRYGPCLGAADALAHWLPVTFRGRHVPDAHAAELSANYGARQGSRGRPG